MQDVQLTLVDLVTRTDIDEAKLRPLRAVCSLPAPAAASAGASGSNNAGTLTFTVPLMPQPGTPEATACAAGSDAHAQWLRAQLAEAGGAAFMKAAEAMRRTVWASVLLQARFAARCGDRGYRAFWLRMRCKALAALVHVDRQRAFSAHPCWLPLVVLGSAAGGAPMCF